MAVNTESGRGNWAASTSKRSVAAGMFMASMYEAPVSAGGPMLPDNGCRPGRRLEEELLLAGVVLLRPLAVDVGVPVADEVALVEQRLVGAEEGGVAALVAVVEHLHRKCITVTIAEYERGSIMARVYTYLAPPLDVSEYSQIVGTNEADLVGRGQGVQRRGRPVRGRRRRRKAADHKGSDAERG